MTHELQQTSDYASLFLNDIPLMDVRAPIEFAEGAFPSSKNLPLIDDGERHEIGIRYSDLGQDAAIELGHELVQGDTKAARVAAWAAYAAAHPNAALYCFRGGMRSKIAQEWLFIEAGVKMPRVTGGYKSLRGFLLDQLETAAQEVRPIILGGRTGVGKTKLLAQLDSKVDLEKLAWHRGSAFGHHATEQPTQIAFENALSIALLKHRKAGNGPLCFEDESKNIGGRHLPPSLWETLSRAPCVILEASLEERVENTVDEYISQALNEYLDIYGQDEGFLRWSAYLVDSLDRIRKRLGGSRHQGLRRILQTAITHQKKTTDISWHRGWIAALLTEYYDPMYDYQLAKKQHRIQIAGDAALISSHLQALTT